MYSPLTQTVPATPCAPGPVRTGVLGPAAGSRPPGGTGRRPFAMPIAGTR